MQCYERKKERKKEKERKKVRKKERKKEDEKQELEFAEGFRRIKNNNDSNLCGVKYLSYTYMHITDIQFKVNNFNESMCNIYLSVCNYNFMFTLKVNRHRKLNMQPIFETSVISVALYCLVSIPFLNTTKIIEYPDLELLYKCNLSTHRVQLPTL